MFKLWRQQIVRGYANGKGIVAVLLEPGAEGGTIAPINRNVVSAARRIGDTIVGITLDPAMAEAAKKSLPLSKIVVCEAPGNDMRLAENACNALQQADKHVKPDFWMSAHSPYGKNILPRLSAVLKMPCISDITGVHDGEEYERPIYAGNAIARVKCDAPKKAITIRGTSFEASPDLETNHHHNNNINNNNGNANESEIETIKADIKADDRIEFVSVSKTDQKARPDLGSARVIISGGRAFKSKDDFDRLLNALADVIPGSAIGASRAAVDSGLAPNDLQIGQTGKVVAPSLYIAIGISGAIQHVAGMKDSKVIVALNKDGDCPMVSIADYTLTGDIYKLLPELTEKIATL